LISIDAFVYKYLIELTFVFLLERRSIGRDMDVACCVGYPSCHC
jgi:hypothetical protein